jgi:hypothetical protein
MVNHLKCNLKIESLTLSCSNPLLCYLFDSFAVELEYPFIINSNLPNILSQMGDYSYYTFEDGQLRMRGLYHHGFPLLLWDALVQTSYGDEVPVYYGWHFEEHSLQHCEVYIDIPSHPVFPDGSPCSVWVIGNDIDDTLEKVAHMALTALCSQNLPATTCMPISLYLIQDRSDPEWKARMDEASNIF